MIRRTVPQKTISKETNLSGVRLQTGEHVNITFKPAPDDKGLVIAQTLIFLVNILLQYIH